MLVLIAGNTKLEGDLKNYEFVGNLTGGEDLQIRLNLAGDQCSEHVFPKIPQQLVAVLKNCSLDKLKDATIDLNRGSVQLAEIVSDGNTMKSGENRRATVRRSPSKHIGGGGLLG